MQAWIRLHFGFSKSAINYSPWPTTQEKWAKDAVEGSKGLSSALRRRKILPDAPSHQLRVSHDADLQPTDQRAPLGDLVQRAG